MDNQFLLESEQIITTSDNSLITLTTHRIRYNDSVFGRAHITSIMLEKISSIEIHYKSWIVILIIGILSAGLGIVAGANYQDQLMGLGLLLGIVFVLIYLITRKHIVTIASDGGAKINFQTKGMKREALLKFINEIEKAKDNRVRLIK